MILNLYLQISWEIWEILQIHETHGFFVRVDISVVKMVNYYQYRNIMKCSN